MTTWYFDSVDGLDTNNGTSPSTPKQHYDNLVYNTTAPGDTFLFKRGTTQTINTIYKFIRSGTSNAWSYYGVYGTGATDYATFVNPTGIGNTILNGANIKYLTFENLRFNAVSCRVAINCSSQGLTDSTHHVTFRKCHFYNSLYSGIYASRESTAPNGPHHYLFEDCEAYDNGAHGLSITGEWCVVLRGRYYNNCATSEWGGHGISTLWNRTEVTTGWTNTPGTNIWYRTLGVAELDVKYLSCYISFSFIRKVKNTITPTTPNLDEFGVSGGLLYLNIGATNPNTISTNYAWGRCGNNMILYAEAFNNRFNPATPWHEGHGIAFDDFTEDSLMLGCYSHDNEGTAFTMNRGDRNMIIGCIAENNWQGTLGIAAGQNNIVMHVTSRNNNIGLGAATSEIYTSNSAKGTIIRNCILEGTSSYGINLVDSNDIVSNINLRGYATPVSTNLSANNITDFDPQFNAHLVPQNENVRSAGMFIGGGLTDFKGRKFKYKPCLGAIEAQPTILFRRVV